MSSSRHILPLQLHELRGQGGFRVASAEDTQRLVRQTVAEVLGPQRLNDLPMIAATLQTTDAAARAKYMRKLGITEATVERIRQSFSDRYTAFVRGNDLPDSSFAA